MQLNNLSPATGAKKAARRLGRGIGSGFGKTCARGHKGQKARSGGYHKVGFEGGQMPIQRRLPKSGFISRKSLQREELRIGTLSKLVGDELSIEALRNSKLISATTKFVKVFASGKIDRAITVKGVPVTKGAKAAIEAAGGKVES